LLIPQLKVSLTLVVILLTFNIAAMVIGSLQPPNPALRGFIEGCEDKPQPCWYGVVPGVTTAKNATEILSGIDNTFCDAHLISDTYVQTIEAIELKECEGIRVGDLLLQFGMGIPSSVYPSVFVYVSIYRTFTSTWPYSKIYKLRLSNE
jgi:hypothetical protein